MSVSDLALWSTILGLPIAVFVAWLAWRSRPHHSPEHASDTPHIITSELSGKCLDTPWETHLDTVHLWNAHHSRNQQWLFRPARGNSVAVISRLTGKCIEVADQLTVDGARVRQANYRAHPSQHWVLTPLGNGRYRIHNDHSGKCLDVSNWNTNDGALLVQWSCHGDRNQVWMVEPPFN
jgi:hypothetical protein